MQMQFSFLPLYIFLVWFVTRVILALCQTHTPSQITPPGNKGLPIIGETLQFMAAMNSSKGFYEFVRIRRLRYGNCFRTKLFGKEQVFISSTEWAKKVLTSDIGKFGKRYIQSIAELVGDQSLLCAQQHHKFIRSRLSHLLSPTSISSFVVQFDQLIVTTLSSWIHKSTIVIHREALEITSKAMYKILISLEDEEDVKNLQKDVDLVCEAMLALPFRFPFTRFYKGLQARKRIMSRLDDMINERRHLHEQTPCQDLMQHLLAKKNDEAISLTDEQIKDNILTMIIAGQDTTASAITWMIKYLDENQEVLNTLRAEQLSLAKRNSTKSNLTLEDLNEMEYASKVVKESLRLASVVPWFPRLALHDCQIQGYQIKKGWNINIDARSVHSDPNVYCNPDKFIPSRFDDELKSNNFLAFGMGGRTCLGINLARAMMLIFVHRLVTTYRWRVTNTDSSIEKWALFSRLKNGCPIQITPLLTEDIDYTN